MLLSVFPLHWADNVTPIALLYHTVADGDFGSFRLVSHASAHAMLQCMTCNEMVNGISGAEAHVFSGKPTNNAKKYMYVFGVPLSLSMLVDHINDGLLQAYDIIGKMQAKMQEAQPLHTEAAEEKAVDMEEVAIDALLSIANQCD
jgi:hypothetical protein